MKILDFNIKKGVYSFEFGALETEEHAHPVVEIISATTQGGFSIEIDGHIADNLVFAIVAPNVKHKVVAQHAIRVLMVESYNPIFSNFLESKHLTLDKGAFLKTKYSEKEALVAALKTLINTTDLKTPTDKRVADGIAFIEARNLEYKALIPELTANLFLSHSRLSHLFKAHVGISMKKYLVWNKLKQAIHLYLKAPNTLTGISLESGFFDQAHLSKAFKEVLGVSPSKAYNSRILQF